MWTGGLDPLKASHFLVSQSYLPAQVRLTDCFAPCPWLLGVHIAHQVNSCVCHAAQWNARADTRDRRFLGRGERWESYDESIMFDAPYRSRDAGQDVQGLQRQQQREVYPYDREDVPRVSTSERRPYGVETSSPDSLVPNDDWNEQPPPRR